MVAGGHEGRLGVGRPVGIAVAVPHRRRRVVLAGVGFGDLVDRGLAAALPALDDVQPGAPVRPDGVGEILPVAVGRPRHRHFPHPGCAGGVEPEGVEAGRVPGVADEPAEAGKALRGNRSRRLTGAGRERRLRPYPHREPAVAADTGRVERVLTGRNSGRQRGRRPDPDPVDVRRRAGGNSAAGRVGVDHLGVDDGVEGPAVVEGPCPGGRGIGTGPVPGAGPTGTLAGGGAGVQIRT